LAPLRVLDPRDRSGGMTAAHDTPGDAAGVGTLPPYGFSPGFVAAWLATLPRPRNLGEEGERMLAGRMPPPVAMGTEHIPPVGTPFVLAMNHYERPGLRVWWPAAWVSATVWRARGEQPPVRWLIADRAHGYRAGPLRVPDAAMAWLLRRVARRYGALAIPRASAAGVGRSQALRLADAALRGPGGRPIGITPEAARGSGPTLAHPEPNAGAAIAWLARGGIPVLPVGVYEAPDPTAPPEVGATPPLTARFGAPLALPWTGLREAHAHREELSDTVMRAIATLLPERFRGPYAAPIDDARGIS
jgi:hypothetical protein